MSTAANFDSQIAAFLARLPNQADQTGAEEPQVIFRGDLELDREREDHMVQDTFRRIGELETENGYQKDGASVLENVSAEGVDLEKMKRIPKRQFLNMVFHMKMDWRREAMGGIYRAGRNLHMPFTRRTVQQMIARAQNHFCGSDPFCHATPVGVQEPEASSTANEWAQHKFKGAGLRSHLMKGIELAGIGGEVVIKKGYRRDQHSYETTANVLVVPDETAEGGFRPLLDAKGEHIIEGEDEWALNEQGQMVLTRDGQTLQPEGYSENSFQPMKIRRKIVAYSGPDARPVDFRNFLAPIDAPDLQCLAADTVVEYYDMTAIEIVQMFIRRMQEAGKWDANQYPRTMEYLRSVSSNSKSSGDFNRPEIGETKQNADKGRGDPVIHVAEVHRWFDATQTGQLDSIHMLLDRDTQRPILYDHTANVFEDGKRPYTSIAWWPIDGSWCGIGAVEVFWTLQDFIDLQVNRWDMSLSESGSKTFFNAEMTVEGQANPKLSINDQSTFRKRDPNMPADRILERIQLYEFKGAKLEGLIQFVGQLVTNMSGVANANDAAAVNLDTQETATGVNNIAASGEEMFAPILVNLEPGVTEVCADSLAISVERMDDEEAFEVLGADGQMILKVLKKQDAKSFRWHVALEVSANKGERDVAQSTAATEAGKDYLMLPPPMQAVLAPLYRQRLRAHGVKDVHKIIVVPTPEQIQAWQVAQQAAAAQQNNKPPQA
jgi:hypothetical protein